LLLSCHCLIFVVFLYQTVHGQIDYCQLSSFSLEAVCCMAILCFDAVSSMVTSARAN
jgi:hypothetical protein